MKIAVFDIGTNSIHMKIVEIHDDLSFEVLGHEKDMTRIGDGSFLSKKLSKRAMKRAFKVIERFYAIARDEGVSRCVAVATSAVRDAKNGQTFVESVRKKTGVKVRVISGEEEGRLIFLGACSDSKKKKSKTLSVDIGGGSVEFVVGNTKKIDFVQSLPLGVARLRDRFITKDPASKNDLRSLEDYLKERIAEVAQEIGRKGFGELVMTAGTAVNLASIMYEIHERRPLNLHGRLEFKAKEILSLYRKVDRMNLKRIRKISGVDKKRADTVVVGCALFSAIIREFKLKRLIVSDKGIREGLVLDTIIKTKMKLKRKPPCLGVQWFGRKPFFSGRILSRRG